MIVMTEKQRAVLSHKVSDPDSWLAHAIEYGGEEWAQKALEEKVARWEKEYDDQCQQPGYKCRAELQAEEEAELKFKTAEQLRRRAQAKAQKDAELDALIAKKIEAMMGMAGR